MAALASLFRTFPAASRAAFIALSLSAVAFTAARIYFSSGGRPQVFILGDSDIGNYRLVPGDRLQDVLERKEPGIRVVNWAEPGATPLDLYLQYRRGTLLAGRPQAVVIAFEPPKFISKVCPHRLDDGGANLRWLPWSREGLSLLRHLSRCERNEALVQQASLPFFALADALQQLWVRCVQWPHERAAMFTAGEERRRRIEAKARERAEGEVNYTIPGEEDFAAQTLAKDAQFLLAALRADGVETRVILMPYGNPELLRKTCSPEVLAKHDTVLVRMRHWLQAQSVAYIDLNAPGEMAHFPAASWDDLDHMKDPAAFAYVADRVHQSLAFSPALRSRFSLADTPHESDAPGSLP